MYVVVIDDYDAVYTELSNGSVSLDDEVVEEMHADADVIDDEIDEKIVGIIVADVLPLLVEVDDDEVL